MDGQPIVIDLQPDYVATSSTNSTSRSTIILSNLKQWGKKILFGYKHPKKTELTADEENYVSSDTNSVNSSSGDEDDGTKPMNYTIDEVPPLPQGLVLGFQHYLVMFGATVSCPFIIAGFILSLFTF